MQNQNIYQFSFQDLPSIPDLTNSANLIDSYIKGYKWTDSFNCITELRKINKYYPEYLPDILNKFTPIIIDLLNTGKTLLVKNILKFIKEVFDVAQNFNVQKAVFTFLPVLIKKASTEIGQVKSIAQEVLTSFSKNCGYQISFVIACQFCCDKNSCISELSIKLLAVLIQNVGSGIMQFSEGTLNNIMKCLKTLIDAKRKNMSNSALDICIFICNAIGSDNYMQLMQYCLKPNEIQVMETSMEAHRMEKEKPIRLKHAIENRRTEKFNVQFFNDEKYNNNFITLLSNASNYNNQNYNYDQFSYSNSYN